MAGGSGSREVAEEPQHDRFVHHLGRGQLRAGSSPGGSASGWAGSAIVVSRTWSGLGCRSRSTPTSCAASIRSTGKSRSSLSTNSGGWGERAGMSPARVTKSRRSAASPDWAVQEYGRPVVPSMSPMTDRARTAGLTSAATLIGGCGRVRIWRTAAGQGAAGLIGAVGNEPIEPAAWAPGWFMRRRVLTRAVHPTSLYQPSEDRIDRARGQSHRVR